MWRGASKPWMVAVEDPQVPGRDIGVATREMPTITSAWAEAASVLRPCHVGAPAAAAGRLVLSAVVDVKLAVGRGAASVGKHAQLQRRAGVSDVCMRTSASTTHPATDAKRARQHALKMQHRAGDGGLEQQQPQQVRRIGLRGGVNKPQPTPRLPMLGRGRGQRGVVTVGRGRGSRTQTVRAGRRATTPSGGRGRGSRGGGRTVVAFTGRGQRVGGHRVTTHNNNNNSRVLIDLSK